MTQQQTFVSWLSAAGIAYKVDVTSEGYSRVTILNPVSPNPAYFNTPSSTPVLSFDRAGVLLPNGIGIW